MSVNLIIFWKLIPFGCKHICNNSANPMYLSNFKSLKSNFKSRNQNNFRTDFKIMWMIWKSGRPVTIHTLSKHWLNDMLIFFVI